MATFWAADASEYLAITGWGIDDVKLEKKAWVWVGQQCKKFDITPVNYEFEVHAMSSEKLPFILRAVFTIGPMISEDGGSRNSALLLYAKLIAPHDKKNSSHVRELVKGIIEGETRVLAASLTMEEIFQRTKNFKQAVFENVQLELNQFGLYIHNANVKQLVIVDAPGQEYFSYLGQKTQQGAMNPAKVDVAEAQMGGTNEPERTTLHKVAEVDAQTKIFHVRQEAIRIREQAKVEAEVKVFENEREAVVAAAKADLATKKAAWERQTKVAEVEASKAVAIREAELEMEVERKNTLRLTEKLEAEQLCKANTQVQESKAALYTRQKAAEAKLYEQQKAAEARKAQAEAQFFKRKLAEDAKLYAKQKEAESLAMVGKAKANYVASMLQALGGDYLALRDYLINAGSQYQEMARIIAGAMNGTQPNGVDCGGSGVCATNLAVATSGGAAMHHVAGVYKTAWIDAPSKEEAS